MSLADRLDAAIALVSPEWAARRRIARLALSHSEQLGFAGPESTYGRLDRAPLSRGASADYMFEATQGRRRLVERARLADDEHSIAGAILDRSVENVVGAGFRLQALTDDPEWNKAAEELWNAWASDKKAADSAGLQTWHEMQALGYRGELRDGDSAFVRQDDGTIRLVESDEIADPKGGYTRPDMVDGIELDGRLRPLAFHVFDPSPDMIWPDRRVAPSRRYPVDQVIFNANRKRASGTRGLTRFKGLFWILDQSDGSREAITVAIRMAACFGLALKRDGGNTPVNAQTTLGTDGRSRRKIHVEPGGVMTLGLGESVEQIKPNAASGDVQDHLDRLERIVCSRFPVTLEQVLGNYNASNFSNTRHARMEAKTRAEIEQVKQMRVSTTAYFWKLEDFMFKEGKLPKRPDAIKHRWIPPRWRYADEVTEFQGAQAAIDGALSTRTAECARLGIDFEEDVVEVLARETEMLAKAKIPVVRSTLTRDPVPPGGLQEGSREPQRPKP